MSMAGCARWIINAFVPYRRSQIAEFSGIFQYQFSMGNSAKLACHC